jgi:hypothetical protein
MPDPNQTVDESRGEDVQPVAADSLSQPQRIGRYGIQRVLGQGGFGIVYLAYDEQLHRPVALKVPHRRLVSRPEEAAAYLTEARTVAGLDHPHIVPVYDVGSTEHCPCYVVSNHIEGRTLARAEQYPVNPLGSMLAQRLNRDDEVGVSRTTLPSRSQKTRALGYGLEELCPLRVRGSWPVAASHIFTVWSLLAEASRCPSGLKATL